MTENIRVQLLQGAGGLSGFVPAAATHSASLQAGPAPNPVPSRARPMTDDTLVINQMIIFISDQHNSLLQSLGFPLSVSTHPPVRCSWL